LGVRSALSISVPRPPYSRGADIFDSRIAVREIFEQRFPGSRREFAVGNLGVSGGITVLTVEIALFRDVPDNDRAALFPVTDLSLIRFSGRVIP
jgi:hypothetical protein